MHQNCREFLSYWTSGYCLLVLIYCSSASGQTTPRTLKIGKYPQDDPVRFVAGAGQPLVDAKRVSIDTEDRLQCMVGGKQLSLSVKSLSGDWRVEPTVDFPSANQVLMVGKRILLASDDGVQVVEDGKLSSLGLGGHKVVGISVAKDGRIAAAARDGAFEYVNGTWKQLVVEDGLGRQWATGDVRAVVYDAKSRLWIAQLAGLACRTNQGWKFYDGRDGLPYNDFTCAAAGEDGRVWFGTRIGLVGFSDGKFFYREGPRFMPGNDIRSMAVASDGTPWLATDGGVAALKNRIMTLAEKAEHYEQQLDRYIKRTPYGYTSEVSLKAPGDYSEIIYSDSDNDGLWTAMYGASQCFAVAVTGSEKHRAAAKQSFEAIRFLQKVTQGGSHSPPRGYIARTILPTNGRNPNDGRRESDMEMKQRDRGWKIYEPRWPTSADGKWYWKSDTSSDELDGHFFFLPLYYDLVANTESEKERVREVVRDLADHLIKHNYQLVDIDGQPTRWGVFNPENLNQNPQWWEGRGLNSLSILAYMVVAEHVTGDMKYAEAIEYLRRKHSYEANAMVAKIQFGAGSGNQSDDEMAIMSFYSLLKYAKDDQLRSSMRFSMFSYWSLLSTARNPFFNYAYAVHGLDQEHSTLFSKLPLDPWDGWLEDSLGTLKGFPLDRLNWPQQNSHRLDLVALPRVRGGRAQTSQKVERGYCVDGKVLPIENRHFNHWNSDAWRINYAGDGRELASGTVFLLPYYMGRYHGFIEE